MTLPSRAALCGALAGLAVLIGAANGPAHASLTLNSLTLNALTANALPQNRVETTGLGELNGVAVEAVRLPEDAGR